MKKLYILILTGLLSLATQIEIFGQDSKKELDRKAIKSMLGCFNVEFKYTETFAPEVDYEKAYDYTSAAFEWAGLVEESEDKIVIQHLLIINDSMIIKHWRQDWVYEDTHEFIYDKDFNWKIKNLDPTESKGKWTQKVYQVDDSPRYSGTATWTHVDGVSRWYNKADSPLPRREYSKRSDYNVMKRGNQVLITDYGWLHEQDNDKIIREDGKEDILLVQEKGFNTYQKRPDQDCHLAMEWWKENQKKWAYVREVWDQELYAHPEIKLHHEKDGKKLYEHLFYSPDDQSNSEIESLIKSYIHSGS